MNQKKPLRIGIDCRVLQGKNYSGIPNYAYYIIDQLLKIDQNNQYVLFFNFFKNIKKDLPVFERKDNVEYRIYRVPNNLLEFSWRFFSFPKIDKLLKVDIFFSPHIHSIPLSKQVKKIMTIHDLSFLKNRKYFNHKSNLWHWFMNPKKMCQNYNKIIAVSSSTKNDIKKLYKIKAEKIEVIPNGYEEKNININIKNESDILKKFELEKNRYFLFLATLEPRKNVSGIIDAFSSLEKKEKYKLVIAGKKGWLFQNIFRKVKKYKLEKNIIFTGFISEEEKEILFKNSSIFIFPSFCEGFGIPILEAKRFKRPVITSATSSMPEIIKDGAILVNPHFINDIAQSIHQLESRGINKRILSNKAGLINNQSWRQSANRTLKYILN